MSLKDQRQNRYQGAIQVIRPSNAFSQRKEQEANFFAEMADNFAKDAYDSAVSKGKIKASLAADSYKFTRQLQKFEITDSDGTKTTYEKEVPVPYKFPEELQQYSDTQTFQQYQDRVAQRYINELETISSDIILKEESRAIMDGVDQITYESGVRGPLEAFYETLTPNVSNILKLSDEKLIIQRGRIVQNNYNERQIQELSNAITDATNKARTEAYDLLIEGQDIKPAIDLYISKLNATTGSDRYLSGEIKKETKVLNDMQKLYKILQPHIISHNEETNLDKLIDTNLIVNGYLKGRKSVTLQNETRLDISMLNNIDDDAIKAIASRLEDISGSNTKFQQQQTNRNTILNSIKQNGIDKFGIKSGVEPKKISQMLDDDPKFINKIYEIYLKETQQDPAKTISRNNPINDTNFRILMFNNGIIPSTLKNNISNALETNDPEQINRYIEIIKEIKNAKVTPSGMGFTETEENKIYNLGFALSRSSDYSTNSSQILRFTQDVNNAKELGMDKMMEEYKRLVVEKYGSNAKFFTRINERFDNTVSDLPPEIRNGLEDVYYGQVVLSRVLEKVNQRINQGGAELSDDMLDDVIVSEINNMLGSGQYGFSTRGISFRRFGNPEDDFGIGDVINPLQYVPDFIYDADAVNRKGTFMFNPPEVHHGIEGSVEYLVPFATQKVKNYFNELRKVSPDVLTPENIGDQIRFIPNDGLTGTDFIIVLVTPSGEEQTLADANGMLKLEHNLIQKIKGDLRD